MQRVLNLGCGTQANSNCTNVDLFPYDGVDVLWDLNNLPLPFRDEEFDIVICQDILEHVGYVPLMEEIARILKKGGEVQIRVPHFTYHNSHSDVTHVNQFCFHTFHSFVRQEREQDSLWNMRHFRKITTRIEFERRFFMFWNYLVDALVNFNEVTKELYERTPLRIFPAMNLYVTLTK